MQVDQTLFQLYFYLLFSTVFKILQNIKNHFHNNQIFQKDLKQRILLKDFLIYIYQ